MPDMPQNLGVIIRTAACLEFPLHVIKPLSFSMSDKRFKGAVMDYINHCDLTQHESWEDFKKYSLEQNKRIILATTKTNQSFFNYQFYKDDIVMFGKETSGVPEVIHQTIKEKITIPMNINTRSLNLATSVSMIATKIISQY